jgi:hypothetical protein
VKKPSKTREELEAAIRLEMEDICEMPTDLAVSVVHPRPVHRVDLALPRDSATADIKRRMRAVPPRCYC